jgi:hypothetical protein
MSRIRTHNNHGDEYRFHINLDPTTIRSRQRWSRITTTKKISNSLAVPAPIRIQLEKILFGLDMETVRNLQVKIPVV